MAIKDILNKVLAKKNKVETEIDIDYEENNSLSEVTKKSFDSIVKTIKAKTHRLEEFNQFKLLFDNKKYDEAFKYVSGSVNIIGNLLANDKYIEEYTKDIYDEFMSGTDSSDRMFRQFETFIKGNKKFTITESAEIDNIYNIYKYYRDNTQRDH